tara:strand:- start:153 stop:737 length:585 start_codon:yes stop_codon:yes gene_type:complete
MSAYLATNDAINLIVTYWLEQTQSHLDNRTKFDCLEFIRSETKSSFIAWHDITDIHNECNIKSEDIPQLLVDNMVAANKKSLDARYGDPLMWKGSENYKYKKSEFAFDASNVSVLMANDVNVDFLKVASITKNFMSQCSHSSEFRSSIAYILCTEVLLNVLNKVIKQGLKGDEYKFNCWDFEDKKIYNEIVRVV